MLRTSLRVFSVLIAGFAIGGCGGSSHGQSAEQDKQLNRVGKEASSPYATEVQELYIAYFGRPADPAGLANFESALAAAGAPTNIESLTAAYASNPALQSLIDSFGASKESQTLYGGGGTQDFVSAVFQHVLGRAPQSDGLAYWSNAIDSGALSKGDAALAIMAGALANSTAQGQTDTQLINNRLAVAAAFTAQVASQGVTSAYSGAAAAGIARSMLGQVDANTNITSFAQTVNSTINNLVQATTGISLFAGNMEPGDSLLFSPAAVAMDASGTLYVADGSGIFKVASNGTTTILAGRPVLNSGSNVGTTDTMVYFEMPSGIALDSAGNVFVTDAGSQVVQKITSSGVVTIFAGQQGAWGYADGTGTAARFGAPGGLAIDSNDNLYVADTFNDLIRKITPAGVVTTIAGAYRQCSNTDGVGAAARFCEPSALAIDAAGSLYVADKGNATIRKITAGGVVSTVAGMPGTYGWANGTGVSATFCAPSGIAIDGSGNLFVSDGQCPLNFANDYAIREVTPDGVVSSFAGTSGGSGGFINGPGATASFDGPLGLAFDTSGNLMVADWWNGAIRKVSPAGVVSTFVSEHGFPGTSDGTGAAAGFFTPAGIAADNSGNLYVADSDNDTIRKISRSGVVTTLAGAVQIGAEADGTGTTANFNFPIGVAVDPNGNVYVTDAVGNSLRVVSPSGVVTTKVDINTELNSSSSAFIHDPTDVALDSAGNIYVVDPEYCRIIKISQSVTVTLVEQDAQNTLSHQCAQLATGLAVDQGGNLYVSDAVNNTIRKITPQGVTSIVAGTSGAPGLVDGTGAVARFNGPAGLAMDSTGNLYVADVQNNAIRKITPSGVVTTVAGSSSNTTTMLGALPGGIFQPRWLTVVGTNTLYVTTANAILRIQLP